MRLRIWLERVIFKKSFSPVIQNGIQIFFPRFIRAFVSIFAIIIAHITLICFVQIIADIIVFASFAWAKVCTWQVNCQAVTLTGLAFCFGTGTWHKIKHWFWCRSINCPLHCKWSVFFCKATMICGIWQREFAIKGSSLQKAFVVSSLKMKM